MNRSIEFNSEYLDYKDDIFSLIENFSSSNGHIIKDHRNIIKKFKLGDFEVNIKSFGKPPMFNAFIYSFFRLTKAHRSFDYARKLLKKGIKTPSPICYCEYKSKGILNSSFYVSKQLKFDYPISDVINNVNFPNRVKILNDFVLFTFKLHENGINFLDHSPGNTLVKFHNSSPIFYLIDLNRMKFEKMNFTKRIMNFRRLTNDKEVLKIISKEYARLYNRDFDEVFSLMVKYSNQFLSRRSFRKKLKKILVK